MQEMKETRFHYLVRKIPQRRAWQPTPVFLRGEYHGQRGQAVFSSQGLKELDKTEATQHAPTGFAAICSKNDDAYYYKTTSHIGSHIIFILKCKKIVKVHSYGGKRKTCTHDMCTCILNYIYIISVQFSHLVMSNSLQPDELQHARLPCPSPAPRACSNLRASHP